MEVASVSGPRPDTDKPQFVDSRWRYVMLVPAWLMFVWSVACCMGSVDRHWPILGLPAFWLLVPLAVLIHEAGHAIAAWLCGWRVIVFAVGPFAYHVTNRDMAWLKSAERQEYAGYVLPAPRRRDVWTPRRNRLITLGGPLANVLTATILFGLFLAPIDWGPVGRSDPRQFAFASALLSLSIALGSITDAQQLFGKSRISREDRDRYGAFAVARVLLDYQMRLRDLPDWLIQEMTIRAAGERDYEGAVNALVVGMVLDDLPRTLPLARSMLDDHRARFGASVWVDDCDVYFSAIWEGDAARARNLLQMTPRKTDEQPLGFAAEAAVLAREGDWTGAKEMLDQMREAVRAEKSPFPNHTFIDIERHIAWVGKRLAAPKAGSGPR